MINIYIDCELTHLPAYPQTETRGLEPGLVSIGCVSEDDQIFYAENTDVPTDRFNDFVIDTVLPLLDGGAALMTYATIAAKLKDWIEALGDQAQMQTDAPYVDWPPVRQLFETYGWPINLVRDPVWLWLDDGLVDNLFIKNVTMRRHHALDDALMNKLGDGLFRTTTK